MEVIYTLKREHIPLLRERYGRLVRGELPKIEGPIFVVGDASANFVLNNGLRPQIIIYDRKVERRQVPKDLELAINDYDIKEIKVKNPQSTLTHELVEAVKVGLNGKVKIFVEGEDDLTALAIIALAKKGTLLYGLPKAGMLIVDINEAKKHLKSIIDEIEF